VEIHVAAVPTGSILPLRKKVLRDGTPSQDPRYSEDDLTDTVHFAAITDDGIIGTSTWLPREYPHDPGIPAVQLKGMAVDQDLQSSGIGALLLRHGIEEAQRNGARLVWARARDTALAFYERNGFRVEGDAFMDDATGMSHHMVVVTIN
jgi:GNAT superfamily N-acetyltransferase